MRYIIYWAVSRKTPPGQYSITAHQHAPLKEPRTACKQEKTLLVIVPESHYLLVVGLFFLV